METKFTPTSLTIPLGKIEESQERRKAYDKAAANEGIAVGRWARELLDKASGFKRKE